VAARGGELAYPDAWPPLKAGGADYQLIVEGGSRRSDEGGAFGQGFSRLNPDQAARVQSRAAHLRRRPLSEPALTLLLAELHLGYGLRSEAAEMLAALPGGDQIAAIQHRLGEAYLKMGLFAEAEAALERALALAQAAGWQEAEAAAHAGLGLAACGRWDAAEAQGQWKKAQAQYQALEMETQAGEVAGWLKQAQICPPPPTP
jgi:tetratricopeptide (TPR) repeat protein